MAYKTLCKDLKIQLGAPRATNKRNTQKKFDELYANDASFDSQITALELQVAEAGAVDSVSVNGGAAIEPDQNKNINLTLDKNTVGLGNVKNADTTNASNITSGTLAEARISGSIARIDGTNLVYYYTKTEIDKKQSETADALRYKHGIKGVESLTSGKVGDVYKAAAKFVLGAEQVRIGDLVIAKKDTTTFDATAWEVIPSGDDGDVYADEDFPAGDKVLLSDGTGKKVKSSGMGIVTVVDANASDANLPTAKAVKDYASGVFVAKETGKGLSTNDYTSAEKTKLAGIAAGAQVNTLTGVKGEAESTYRTGKVNITKANVGLGNVDNTADADKPVSSYVQTALNLKSDKIKSVTFSASDWTAQTGENAQMGNYVLIPAKARKIIRVYKNNEPMERLEEVDVQITFALFGYEEQEMIFSDIAFAGRYLYLEG